jgi:hypothetical protein
MMPFVETDDGDEGGAGQPTDSLVRHIKNK